MSIFAALFEHLIGWFYQISQDYGVAIVMITVCVRLLLLPLSCKQRKAAGEQREVAEEAERIWRKYTNKERQEAELARLYREKGTGVGGCVTSFIQFPVMICLYNAVRKITAVECGTILLPWVTSLLVRDPLYILPIVTIIIQILPQFYPYMQIFSLLKLQKQSGGTVVILMLMNSVFTFMIPTGIGLYYFVSGLFQAVEQFIYNLICVRKIKVYA